MLKIKATKRIESAIIDIPYSKSISTRLVLLNALSDGLITYDHLSEADDAIRLKRCLEWIDRCHKSNVPLILDAGNSGAVMRFLTAYLSIVPGVWMLTGSDRLKDRPIKELVDALRKLGADIKYAGKTGQIPLIIKGRKLKGGPVKLDLSKSSQYATALLLIANETSQGIRLKFDKHIPSMSYLNMTLDLLKKAGLQIEISEGNIVITAGPYKKITLINEKDWSAASFWYEIFLLSGMDEMLIRDLRMSEIQGDAVLPDLFRRLGIWTSFTKSGAKLKLGVAGEDVFEFDFSNHIDLVLPVAISLVMKKKSAVLKGLKNLKHKESDRLQALLEILDAMKVSYKTDHDSFLELKPSKPKHPGLLDCRNDHRLIMSLTPLALKFGEIEIKNHEEVEKSYPGFYEEIKKAGLKMIPE